MRPTTSGNAVHAARSGFRALVLVGSFLLTGCVGSFGSRSQSPEPKIPAAQEERGDFRAGDMVRVTVRRAPELSGEFRVDQNLALDLGRLGTLPLQGVTRSELTPLVEARVREVMLNTTVTVEPLMRVAVLGEVGQPGFYLHPAEASLSDVLGSAGGPTHNADLDRIEISRAQERRVVSPEESAKALSHGWSLDRLGLKSGDRIEVGRESRRNWLETARDVAYGIGAIATVVAIFTRF